MMSLAFSPATPRAGRAQKGWIMLVHWSPQAMAMAARPASTPSLAEAGMTIGPWTAHWPPPEGTKKFTTPADRNVHTGKLTVVEMFTKKSEMMPARHTSLALVAVIRPMMPA